MRDRIILASIILLNCVSLYSMELERFTLFSELAPELQGKVIKRVDNMSYIGQVNKECYAEVKSQQVVYIAKMYRVQDFTKVKLNIPSFIFFGKPGDGYNPHVPNPSEYYIFSGVYVIDPNNRFFYKPSTIEKWNSSNVRYPDTFRLDCRGEKHYSILPTNLVIAC